ncbi:beta-galactosidase [Agromyces flavus]|uniref:beta-galactosidase n=1 Tax=Agromyces flavus TaxID=589382 RepID=UPI00361FF5BD
MPSHTRRPITRSPPHPRPIPPRPAAEPRSGWIPGTSAIRFGGDYNPEQWDRERGSRTSSSCGRRGEPRERGHFSWALLEPREGEYDFSSSSTSARPARRRRHRRRPRHADDRAARLFWNAYPHARPVTRDGVPLGFGSRGIVSPISPQYRRAASAIAEKLAERYAHHPVVMWHVHNEYGAPVSDSYDEASVLNFRGWLERRYGSIDALNRPGAPRSGASCTARSDEVGRPAHLASVSNPAHRLDFAHSRPTRCWSASSSSATRSDAMPRSRSRRTSWPRAARRSTTEVGARVDIVSNDHYLTASRLDAHVMLAMDADFHALPPGRQALVLMEHSTSP